MLKNDKWNIGITIASLGIVSVRYSITRRTSLQKEEFKKSVDISHHWSIAFLHSKDLWYTCKSKYIKYLCKFSIKCKMHLACWISYLYIMLLLCVLLNATFFMKSIEIYFELFVGYKTFHTLRVNLVAEINLV